MLGSLLAFVLFVSTSFAANHSFHRLLHQDHSDQGHPCLICSIAKGQLCTAEVALAAPSLLGGLLRGRIWMPLAIPASFDFRLSPSRAPPTR